MVLGMLRRTRAVILVGLVTMLEVVLWAQPAVVPFMGGASAPDESGDSIRREGAARRAMELGFSSVAAGLWESLLADTTEADRRDRLVLNWTITLLEDGRPIEAGEALSQLSESEGGRAQLRAGLVAYAKGDSAKAEESLARVDAATLPTDERSWYHYLAGALAHDREDFTEARE